MISLCKIISLIVFLQNLNLFLDNIEEFIKNHFTFWMIHKKWKYRFLNFQIPAFK